MTPPEQPERPRTEGNVTRIPTAFENPVAPDVKSGKPDSNPGRRSFAALRSKGK